MKPDRWPEIKNLYNEIVDLDPTEREARLALISDNDLRHEVISLIRAGPLPSSIVVWLDGERRRVLVEQGAQIEHQPDTTPAHNPRPPALTLKSGDLLAARYQIIVFLGQGGMGEVYEAEDRDLGERIAIKVIRLETSLDQNSYYRFRREVQLARRVTHPNVCRVFDIQHSRQKEHETIFLTMELVRGETLDARLKRTGRLNVSDAFPIAIQLCSALHAAHQADVLHRDLKCVNVMLVGSGEHVRAVITDFGIARLMDSALSSMQTATQQNATLGTPAYMSPEQLAGKDLTPASDVYSLGLVLYEMVTGRRPFQSDSPWKEAMKRLSEDPEPPSRIAPEIGEIWNAAILRCLERDSAKRFSTAQEVSNALQGVRLLHGIDSAHAAWAAASMPGGLSSIAVLPFTNLSGNSVDECFSDGMSEEIINALSHLEGLRVAARTSSFSFKGKAVEIAEIARKLGVVTVLEGSVRKLGNRIRITAQLVNVADGFHLWSERYDREMQDIFAVQDEIARSIAARLKVTLKGKQETLVKAGTDNLEAYEFYLKGRALADQRGRDLPHAWEYFQRAVALDPKYALAWAEMSYGCLLFPWYSFRRPEATFPQAREAALRAAALDPTLAQAHVALACSYLLCEWDWSNGEREFLRAIELNPRYVRAISWYGVWVLQATRGRFEEGLAYAKQASELDPLCVNTMAHLACGYAFCGRNAESVVAAQNAVKLDPESILAQFILAHSLYFQGRIQESIAVAEPALGMFGRHPWFMAFLALAYADSGKPEQARAAHSEMLARAKWEYVAPMHLALSAAAVGELDEAIQHVREAYAIRDPGLTVQGRHWPGTKRLREDHRFREIIDTMGFG